MNLTARLFDGTLCPFADVPATTYVATVQSRKEIAPFVDFQLFGTTAIPTVLTANTAEDLVELMRNSETGKSCNLTRKGSNMFTMRINGEYCVVWIDTKAKHDERVSDFIGFDTRFEQITGISAHRVQGTIYDAPEAYWVCTVVFSDGVNLLSRTDHKTGVDYPFVAENKRDIFKLMEHGFKEGNLKYWRNAKVRDSYYIRKNGEVVELKIEQVKDFLPRIAKGEAK